MFFVSTRAISIIGNSIHSNSPFYNVLLVREKEKPLIVNMKGIGFPLCSRILDKTSHLIIANYSGQMPEYRLKIQISNLGYFCMCSLLVLITLTALLEKTQIY